MEMLCLEQYARHVFSFSLSALFVSAFCLQNRVNPLFKTVLSLTNVNSRKR